jgi:hypothetical protein
MSTPTRYNFQTGQMEPVPDYLLPLYAEDLEHDDLMDADDYDRRQWERDGWKTAHLDRQRW